MVGEDTKFRFEQVMKDGKKIILLQGVIDEDTSFATLSNLGTPITFNFKGIVSINSCGVRSWVNFIKGLQGGEIHYEECPPLIVRQMNMVPSFVGHAKVASVYVPYVCDNCDAEHLELVHSDSFGNIEELLTCEICKKKEMELDGHPEQYFAFTK